MKPIISLLLVFLSVRVILAGTSDPVYSIPASPWPESFGNHRAVIEIPQASEVVLLEIPWRRHDPQPDMRRFLIIDSESGDTVPNIFRYEVTGEKCRIAFGPVKEAGTFYFYYLPYEVQEEWGFYGKDYLKREGDPSGEWMAANNIGPGKKALHYQRAKLISLQARTAFDSFYPMEVIPFKTEKETLLKKYSADYLVFPEDRSLPIRMRDEIPLIWVRKGPSADFSGDACKNEYYAFQLGIYASGKALENIKVEFTSLAGENFKIPSTSITCFNTGGTGPYGQPFEKRVDAGKGAVQPLWIGIDIPGDIPSGMYKGKVTVRPGNSGARVVNINLRVLDKALADRGDSETWRHSRLRWLNSSLGIDDNPVKPYEPIRYLGNNAYQLTEKKLTMNWNGMPASIQVSGSEVLREPVSFVVETSGGPEQFSPPENITLLKNEPGVLSGSWTCHSGSFGLSGTGVVESDGYINFKIRVKALKDMPLRDIRLEIPFTGEARYMIGMGLPGTSVPAAHQAGWRGPYDSFWIGSANAGLWCELRGGSYNGPLLNLYNPAPPGSWYNNDKGGFRITGGSKRGNQCCSLQRRTGK